MGIDGGLKAHSAEQISTTQFKLCLLHKEYLSIFVLKKRRPVQEYFICFYTAAAIVAAERVLEGDCGPDLIGVSDLYIVHLSVDAV